MRALGSASSSCSIVPENRITFSRFHIATLKSCCFFVATCAALIGRLLVNEMYLETTGLYSRQFLDRKAFCLRWQKGDRPDNDFVEPCSIQTKKNACDRHSSASLWKVSLTDHMRSCGRALGGSVLSGCPSSFGFLVAGAQGTCSDIRGIGSSAWRSPWRALTPIADFSCFLPRGFRSFWLAFCGTGRGFYCKLPFCQFHLS